jgi:hypothetical protein
MPRKPIAEQLKERLEQIAQLQITIQKANDELLELLGLNADKSQSMTGNIATPTISPTTAIKNVYEENPTVGYSSAEMVKAIKDKTGYDLNRKSIQSTLDSLVMSKYLRKEGKGRGNVKYFKN